MATIPSALNIESSESIPTGRIALMRHGKLRWVGMLTDPWEDVEFDLMLVSPEDFARIMARFNG